jgi:FtsP/CotA-like multicopper oxidase with cupredoxin domain
MMKERSRHGTASFVYPARVLRRSFFTKRNKPQRRRPRFRLALAALAPLALLGVLAAAAVGALAEEQPTTDDSALDAFTNASAHEAAGFQLAASSGETVQPGPACGPSAPLRRYDVVAINVEMTLNRFLDYEPRGLMYVLEEDLPRVRAEEAQNREARAGRAEPAVTAGLHGDAIQPLTLRVNQGECLRISLRNDLRGSEPASLHLHGSALRLASTGAPAIATNQNTIAASGETVVYEWAVPNNHQEGTHSFHSHGDAREQTNHGLFGAVIVEPRGSTYMDPRTRSSAIPAGPASASSPTTTTRLAMSGTATSIGIAGR